MLGVKRVERVLPVGTPLTVIGEVCFAPTEANFDSKSCGLVDL